MVFFLFESQRNKSGPDISSRKRAACRCHHCQRNHTQGNFPALTFPCTRGRVEGNFPPTLAGKFPCTCGRGVLEGTNNARTHTHTHTHTAKTKLPVPILHLFVHAEFFKSLFGYKSSPLALHTQGLPRYLLSSPVHFPENSL